MKEYEGLGRTLDAAFEDAHKKMKLELADFTKSEVVNWGAAMGGITGGTTYWIKVKQLQ